MAENTKIEWTDHTTNLWWGCTKVHAGCDNCYAEHLSDTRYKLGLWCGSTRKKIKSAFLDLAKFQRMAAKANEVHRVFVGSMMDIFEKTQPLVDHHGNLLDENTGDLRDLLFSKISEGAYPNLVFLLLTKRPSNINKYIPHDWLSSPPENVYFGCSPVDQSTYENFYAHMMKVRGNTFYSIEPQLGEIMLYEADKIDWIIQGGESGPNKRPFNLDWAYEMMVQCEALKIPYFFKQIDKVKPIPADRTHSSV